MFSLSDAESDYIVSGAFELGDSGCGMEASGERADIAEVLARREVKNRLRHRILKH